MAVTLAGGCRVSQMHEGQPLVAGTLRVWPQIGRATGAEAISLSVMEFGRGLSPTMRNDDCDQILYLLNQDSGPGSNDSRRVTIVIDCQTVKLDGDTGIY